MAVEERGGRVALAGGGVCGRGGGVRTDDVGPVQRAQAVRASREDRGVDAEIAVGPVVGGPADEVHADGVAAGDNRGLVDEKRGEPDAGPVRRADANQIARARDDADRGRALPGRATDNAAGCLVVDNDRRIESVAAGGDVIARVVGWREGVPAVVEERRTAAQRVGGAGRAHEGNDIELADLKRDRRR